MEITRGRYGFSYQPIGKARLRATGEDGSEYLTKEYTTNAEKTYTVNVDLRTAPNQAYAVRLELAAIGAYTEAVSRIVEIAWGNLSVSHGEFSSVQNFIRLNYK